MLSEQVYADSSLVGAAVSGEKLAPTNMSAEEFARAASEENGLFVTREAVAERRPVGPGRKVRGRVVRLARRYFQDPKGRLPLHPRDPDARWRTLNGKPARLAYKQHLMVDERGFILAQTMPPATTRDPDAVPRLMDEAPVQARVFAADTSYSLGKLRRFLEERGVQAYIPIHTRHAKYRDKRKGFHLESPTELICPAGKTLKRTTFYKRDDAWLYTTRVSDCRACTQRDSCLTPQSNRKFVQLSTYEAEFTRAEGRNSTARYRRLMRRRRVVVEGVFAHLKDLGFRRVRTLGLCRVQCEGYMVAFAHNILKTIRYLVGPCTGAVTSPSRAGVAMQEFSGVRVAFQPGVS
jgi:IS5 family transposase